ncbi:MAG TPA: hypothetical protein VHQ65_16525, partial [Thermoanaerobaculia bacterium]|nr:hypothetical protein [Thermoanaerobaculia bacterium]
MESVLLLAAGARAAERALLERLDAELAAPAPHQYLEHLALPVRVVVPSNSLRRHVAATVVRHRQRAVLGLQVQTLHALSLEVLERWGEPPPLAGGRGGDLAAELLTRRFAAAEPELARTLGALQDPWGAVAATVRDLLDAGLEPAHAAAAEENLEHGPGSADQRRRARALVRVAAR